ncbi:hypothetical protein [Halomonas sp. PBN3]|uniref:hypothetical protein n=1 Tax=Halomonas sp. PBN3 TaxID=1397528 RepID=UPI0003B81E1B|nr:hypothetical protein [Halomonas sp. PBN3]ERS81723.1 hypothetical protein Q671_13065 [Halomonas sp. PBN3]
MALTPHHVSRLLSFDDVARLLADIGHEKINFNAEEMRSLCNWRTALADALLEGSIEPVSNLRVLSKETGETLIVTSDWMERYHPLDHTVIAKFKREDLCQWLMGLGIAMDDIPEALKVGGGSGKAVLGADDRQKDAGADELRALEALGLLAETFAKLGPKYRKGDAGKPNCAQIAQAMSQQAGDTPGMGERKLAGLLSDALDAWRDKRR